MFITDQALWDSIPAHTRAINANSHCIGVVDDCYRCIDCEIGSWNAWKEYCSARKEKWLS